VDWARRAITKATSLIGNHPSGYFFLWGAMNRLFYATPVLSEEDLIARIVIACEIMRHTKAIFASGVGGTH